MNQVALTTGLSQADALSIAPVAAGKGMPILLTAPGQLPAVVQEYLAAKRATVNKSYVIGGIGAVSETAAAAMPGSVTREFALKNLPSQVVALGGTGVVPDGYSRSARRRGESAGSRGREQWRWE